MTYPDFFDAIPAIELRDPLSAVLGTFAKGEVEISYLEVVKGAGHSCPTVGGAYLMTYHALKTLFPEGRALRGSIDVKLADDLEEGTTGVVANVISYITGATDKSGFKGLGGNFARHSLMAYNQDVQNIRFTRVDTGDSVDVFMIQVQLLQALNKVLLFKLSYKGKQLTNRNKNLVSYGKTE